MAISAVGEGCEKQMTPILGEVVAAVLPFCQDQVKREGWGRKEELEGGGGRVGGRREEGGGMGEGGCMFYPGFGHMHNLIMCRPEIKSHVRIQ